MAAGSFKIYGLQKDGSRIPAAGSIGEGGSSGGASEIITLTQAEFDVLSQTDIANYHANGVRTILVNSMTDILRSYGIDAAGNAVPIGASDALKLGGKPPEYYIQPRNLLDNSNFANPVNQRGQTSYAGAKQYTIDRWKAANADMAVRVENGYISLTNGAQSGRLALEQVMPNNYIGHNLTVAICDHDTGIVYCQNTVIPEKTDSNQYFGSADFNGHSARFHLTTSGELIMDIMVANGKTVNVRWIAVYEGTYTAETLPPYVPKGYDEELLVCNMYSLQDGSFLGPGVQMELLWENASPNSAFAAQTLQIDLAAYQMIGLEFRWSGNWNNQPMAFLTKGSGDRYIGSVAKSSLVSRLITEISDTKIVFGTAYADSAENTAVCVPIKIYGIKGVA